MFLELGMLPVGKERILSVLYKNMQTGSTHTKKGKGSLFQLSGSSSRGSKRMIIIAVSPPPYQMSVPGVLIPLRTTLQPSTLISAQRENLYQVNYLGPLACWLPLGFSQ